MEHNIPMEQTSPTSASSYDLDEGFTDLLINKPEGNPCSCFLRYLLYFLSFLVSILPNVFLQSIKIIKEYERAVVFRLGRLKSKKHIPPGIIYVWPWIDKIHLVDMRIKSVPVAAQNVMTKDSVTIKVDAIVFFCVKDASKAILKVKDFWGSTSLFSATTLRAVVGESELDHLLTKREMVSKKLTRIISETVIKWGIRIVAVEIRDVKLPQNMQRVMASQAEAERDRRAKVISAEGEHQAAQTLCRAADEMSKNPATLQLRYLQTLTQITVEHPTTICYPIPMKMSNMAGMSESESSGSNVEVSDFVKTVIVGGLSALGNL